MDTTVQPKANTHHADARQYGKSRRKLVRPARRASSLASFIAIYGD